MRSRFNHFQATERDPPLRAAPDRMGRALSAAMRRRARVRGLEPFENTGALAVGPVGAPLAGVTGRARARAGLTWAAVTATGRGGIPKGRRQGHAGTLAGVSRPGDDVDIGAIERCDVDFEHLRRLIRRARLDPDRWTDPPVIAHWRPHQSDPVDDHRLVRSVADRRRRQREAGADPRATSSILTRGLQPHGHSRRSRRSDRKQRGQDRRTAHAAEDSANWRWVP